MLYRLCLFALLAALLGCGSEPVGGPVTLTLSHSHAADESSEIHTAALAFQRHLAEHAPDIAVQVHPANQLGQEQTVYEDMQIGGGIHCAISGTAILNNVAPRLAVLDLPFLWRDYEHVHRILDGEIGDQLAADLAERGLIVLAWLDSWGFRNVVTASQPITDASDLEGLKLRTIPTATYIAAVQALGANPTPMAFGEVYTSMQTGVLDGFEHCASAILSNRLYEVGNHLALTRHLYGPLVFCMSKVAWDGLSQQQQEQVRAAARAARDENRARAADEERKALDQLRERGMQITEPDMSAIRQAAVAVQDELAAQNDIADLLTTIRASDR